MASFSPTFIIGISGTSFSRTFVAGVTGVIGVAGVAGVAGVVGVAGVLGVDGVAGVSGASFPRKDASSSMVLCFTELGCLPILLPSGVIPTLKHLLYRQALQMFLVAVVIVH